MNLSALHVWLVIQALVWLPLLTWAGIRNGDVSELQRTAVLTVLPAALLSLWLLLRAGRTVADWVTGLRFLGLYAVLLWLEPGTTVGWAHWVALLVLVLCDLLDGYCARLFGGSDQGAVLDMEADQLVTIILALLAIWFGGIGPWVLLLPAFRYIYLLVLLPRGLAAHDPKPRPEGNTRGRLIAASVMTLLLFCLAPLELDGLKTAASLLAVTLLAYSFGTDTLYLLRRAAA